MYDNTPCLDIGRLSDQTLALLIRVTSSEASAQPAYGSSLHDALARESVRRKVEGDWPTEWMVPLCAGEELNQALIKSGKAAIMADNAGLDELREFFLDIYRKLYAQVLWEQIGEQLGPH